MKRSKQYMLLCAEIKFCTCQVIIRTKNSLIVLPKDERNATQRCSIALLSFGSKKINN